MMMKKKKEKLKPRVRLQKTLNLLLWIANAISNLNVVVESCCTASLSAFFETTSENEKESEKETKGTKTKRTNGVSCVKSIVFSGWNPPPGYRKLMGER